MVKRAKNGQNGQKWSKWSNMVQKWSKIKLLESPIPAPPKASSDDISGTKCGTYHRSAGVKTTGKILKKKLVKNGQNGPKWSNI